MYFFRLSYVIIDIFKSFTYYWCLLRRHNVSIYGLCFWLTLCLCFCPFCCVGYFRSSCFLGQGLFLHFFLYPIVQVFAVLLEQLLYLRNKLFKGLPSRHYQLHLVQTPRLTVGLLPYTLVIQHTTLAGVKHVSYCPLFYKRRIVYGLT